MSANPSSSQFSSFFNSYHNLENSWHRVCIDSVLCNISKNPNSSQYKWELNTLDKSETLEIYHVLCILQPNLSMKYMVTNKSSVILSWSGTFNVPIQYFYEKQCTFPNYPAVDRQDTRKPGNKSKVVKNPWTGRLRSISRVDYTDYE